MCRLDGGNVRRVAEGVVFLFDFVTVVIAMCLVEAVMIVVVLRRAFGGAEEELLLGSDGR